MTKTLGFIILIITMSCSKNNDTVDAIIDLSDEHRVYEIELSGPNISPYPSSYLTAERGKYLSESRDILQNPKITIYGPSPYITNQTNSTYEIYLRLVSGKNEIGESRYNYTERIRLEKNKYKITYKFDNPSIVTISQTDNIGLSCNLLGFQVGTTKLTLTVKYNPTPTESYILVNQSFLIEVKTHP